VRIPTEAPVKFRLIDRFRESDIGLFSRISRLLRRISIWSSTAGNLWAADAAVHGIGRLVFLGTPFFHKRWADNGRTLRNACETALRVFLVVLDQIFYVYILCAFSRYLRSAWMPGT
jgi:hypothetical protein